MNHLAQYLFGGLLLTNSIPTNYSLSDKNHGGQPNSKKRKAIRKIAKIYRKRNRK